MSLQITDMTEKYEGTLDGGDVLFTGESQKFIVALGFQKLISNYFLNPKNRYRNICWTYQENK